MDIKKSTIENAAQELLEIEVSSRKMGLSIAVLSMGAFIGIGMICIFA